MMHFASHRLLRSPVVPFLVVLQTYTNTGMGVLVCVFACHCGLVLRATNGKFCCESGNAIYGLLGTSILFYFLGKRISASCCVSNKFVPWCSHSSFSMIFSCHQLDFLYFYLRTRLREALWSVFWLGDWVRSVVSLLLLACNRLTWFCCPTVAGLLITIVSKMLLVKTCRSTMYKSFYRIKPRSANLSTLTLECWFLGLGSSVLVGRITQFLCAAVFWVGRVSKFWFRGKRCLCI